VQGIGRSADSAFDNVTMNRFNSYTVAANFSYNFGERAARAAHRRARLQEAQAIVALNQVSDGIAEEVNQTVRTLMVRYEQIPPALLAVTATERNLRSLQARTQQINPTFLQTELQTVELLASNRRTLLQVIVDYNLGIVQLERAKGTLLDYNNVVISDADGR
jgi:outer membrane protein TolC